MTKTANSGASEADADNLSDYVRKEQEPPITQASGHSRQESTNDRHVVSTQSITYDADNPYESEES